MIGGDVHVAPGLVFNDDVDVEAKAGEGGVAFAGWQLAQNFIVGPILFGDVDDIPDGAFADALKRRQRVAAVIGNGPLGKSIGERLAGVGGQLVAARDGDLLKSAQLDVADIGALWRAYESASSIGPRA